MGMGEEILVCGGGGSSLKMYTEPRLGYEHTERNGSIIGSVKRHASDRIH